jgi:hypothetical protein
MFRIGNMCKGHADGVLPGGRSRRRRGRGRGGQHGGPDRCDKPALVQRVLLRLLRRALDGMTAITGEHALRVAESLRRRRAAD